MIRITHIISGLGIGGAERMLVRLVTHSDHTKEHIQVISLSPGGYYAGPLRELGIQVVELDFHSPKHFLAAWRSLRAALRGFQPDLVQTWMYHADLFGGLAARALGIPIIWNVRQTRLVKGIHKTTTRAVARLCALLSHCVPHKIITCAHTARFWHTFIGYSKKKFIVIPNGVDTSVFQPDANLGTSLRVQLGLKPHHILVGTAARFAPSKGYRFLIEAIAIIKEKSDLPLKFLLCGNEVDQHNPLLMEWIKNYDVQDVVILLGPRSDMPAVYNALDILLAPSLAEGFSNTLLEGMSCAKACIATTVGDSARLLGDCGLSIPPADSQAIAKAVLALAADDDHRQRLAATARQKVLAQYSIETIIQHYQDVYALVVESKGKR